MTQAYVSDALSKTNMLPKPALAIWQRHALIEANLQRMPSNETEVAWSFYYQISNLEPGDVRARLAASGTVLNRRLAACLLGRALDMFQSGVNDQAVALAEWSRFVAQYGDALKQKADCLEPDATFLIAAALHRDSPTMRIWNFYMEAAELYTVAKGDAALAAIAAFAQGWVALESGILVGSNVRYRGASELFERAYAAFPPGSEENRELKIAAQAGMEIHEAIERSLESPQPLATLSAAIPATEELRTVLKNRVWASRAGDGGKNKAPLLARLHDRLFPDAGSVRLQLADGEQADRRARGAEELLRELLRESPGDPDLLRRLAEAVQHQGRLPEARTLYEQVEAALPEDPQVFGQLGSLSRSLGDTQSAIRYFRRAIELDPSASHYTEILRALEPAVSIRFKDGTMEIGGNTSGMDPDDIAAAMTVAIMAERPETIASSLAELDERPDQGMANKVRRMLRERNLIETPPKAPGQAHLEAAEVLFQEHRWEEALAEYLLAVRADETLAPAYLGLGDAYYQLGKYHLACACFEESIAIQEDPFAWRFLGDCQRRSRRTRAARESYRHALALWPQYAGAQQALRHLEQEEGSL